MAIFLNDEEVRGLLPVAACVEVLDDLFRQEAMGQAENLARRRLRLKTGALIVMGGAVLGSEVAGVRAYGGGGKNLVMLYSSDSGDLEAVLESSSMSTIRTGAATGLATRYMALPDADSVGVIGVGRQAAAQLQAVCAVRPIRHIRAFSRTPESRQSFAAAMTSQLGIEVVPVASAQEAVRGCQIVITITNSRTPVFDGAWLEPGAHVNAAGANSWNRCEIDNLTIQRSELIAVDNLEQAKTECGELILAAEQGFFRWSQAVELKDVVCGRAVRPSPRAITLFESQGLGMEDMAAAAYVLRQARQREIGTRLPF